MEKLLALLAIIGVAAGALFIPRIARGDTSVTDEVTPPAGGISPRGIENNNPMNLEFRTSIQWRGQIGSDGRFAVFDTPLNGLRAGMINIHTKMVRDGLTSVRRIISRLSPAFENPTENFINFVSQRMGVGTDQPLTFANHIIPMSKAIVTFENGQNPYPDSLYREALRETGRL